LRIYKVNVKKNGEKEESNLEIVKVLTYKQEVEAHDKSTN